MASKAASQAAMAPELPQLDPTPIPTQVPATNEASIISVPVTGRVSAAGRVLAIVELLERILLDVADVTKTQLELKGGNGLVAQPSRQVIALTRVNRLFHATILGSKKLEAAKSSPLLTTTNEYEPLEWMAHVLGLDFSFRSSIEYYDQSINDRKLMPVLQFRNLYIYGDVYLPKKLIHARSSAFANPEASWRRIPYSSATTQGPVCLRIHVQAKDSHYREHLVMQDKGTMNLGAVYEWLMGILARSEERHIWLWENSDYKYRGAKYCKLRIEGPCSELCSGSRGPIWA